MKVAIAGTGAMAQYLVEELSAYGHEVVVLTRSIKQQFQQKKLSQRQTDYSVESLSGVLSDCEGLVSTLNTIYDIELITKIHINMLEACQTSPKCKRFIPSEWTGNVEEHPEQPMWERGGSAALYERLRAQNEVKWTVFCVSWFADYVVAREQRYHSDIGELWPMNYANKTFTIYGDGTQLVSLVTSRDTARAIAMLFDYDGEWDEYTYVSGDQISWNDLFAIIKEHDPEWQSKTKPLATTIKQIIANESEESVIAAYFEILSYANASKFSTEKVIRQRSRYFQGMHFQTIDEILRMAAANPQAIV